MIEFTTISINKKLAEKVKNLAKQEHRSISKQAEHLIEQQLKANSSTD